MSKRKISLGIERLCEERSELIKGLKVGLVCNQASVDHDLNHSADVLRGLDGVNLTTLFGPQHGIRGDVQDNMVETPHTIDAETGLPVYSLYSETREPTEKMLEDVDVIVCDLQDVGCRIYTYVYTIANCMRVARRLGKRVVVCDRPNPINGLALEGNVLEKGFESFVGQYQLPTRHGMTACELARMFNEHWGIGCELEVVAMEGWSRELWFDETWEFARKLQSEGLPAVTFRPNNFLPTFQKHAGVTCGGVQIHVLDRREFKPVLTGVAIVKTCYDLYREDFRWKEPPYEYVFDRNPFDVISGGDGLRLAIERGDTLEELEESWQEGLKAFHESRQNFLLY